MTTATPAPAMPRRGNGPQPQINAGESTTRSGPPPTTTTAGSRMLPAPRRTLPSVLKSQKAPEPADVHRLEDVDSRLDGDDDDVGRGQPQQGAGNRRLEEHAGARGEALAGGGRRGGRDDAEGAGRDGHDLLNTSD